MPIGRVYQPPTIHFTPVLNAGLTWEQLNPSERDAFRGVARKVKIPACFRLYKFTVGQTGSGVSPWWSPFEAYEDDAGLRARLHLAQHFRVSPTELTQIVAAVRTNWNPLTHILTATLLKDVYGFWGKAGWQPRSGNEALADIRSLDNIVEATTGRRPYHPGLPGTAGQFFIPNLRRDEHIRIIGVPAPMADVLAGRTNF